MAGETVKVTGSDKVEEYFARVEAGVNQWTDIPIFVGYGKGGAHGRLLERGFHPRGGSTFVPGIFTLQNAKAAAEREIKASVLKSIQGGGPQAAAAKKHLAEMTKARIEATSPHRRGHLAGSVKIILKPSRRGR